MRAIVALSFGDPCQRSMFLGSLLGLQSKGVHIRACLQCMGVLVRGLPASDGLQTTAFHIASRKSEPSQAAVPACK
jgi:hypothetical protein